MDNSWIKLYRKYTESSIFKSGAKANQLWLHLLLNANYKQSKFWLDKFQQEIVVERGEIVFSLRNLLEELNTYHDEQGRKHIVGKNDRMTLQNLRTLLRQFEKRNEIIIKSTQPITHIKIVKYEDYQAKPEHKEEEVTQEVTQDQHKPNTSLTQSKEYKESKEEKNEGYISLTPNQLAKLEEEFPKIEVIKAYERFKLWQKANGHTFKNPLARFRLWLMDEKNLKKPTPTPVFVPNLPKDDELISAEKLEEFRQKRKGLLRT